MNPPSVMIGPNATPFVAVTLEMITSAVKTATKYRVVPRPDLGERGGPLFGDGLALVTGISSQASALAMQGGNWSATTG